MTGTISKPLVLVVDDEPEWQEAIRTMLLRMGAEVRLAPTFQQACEIAAAHSPESAAPLTLVIIDMRMPQGAKEAQLDEQAGIHVLRAVHALQAYGLVQCPMIVFTAWPSYENCVKAVKAGAWAYICKYRDEDGTHGASRGIDELKEWCERIVVSGEPLESPLAADDTWLGRNYDWLRAQFGGQWVATVNRERLGEFAEGLPQQEGVVVLAGSSFDAVRDAVLKLPAALRQTPTIFFVPKKPHSP
jgi:CheY-like chemotaxis protein